MNQDRKVSEWLGARGISRLPESSYGPDVAYAMVPVPGRKSRIRVAVTAVSFAAYRAQAVAL